MRALRLALALVSPALTGWAMLAAQTVERTDVPDRGMIRFTFDPRIMTWNSEFTDAGRLGLGRGLTGDTVGSAYIPSVARLEQDVRLASGVAGVVASLGQGRLSVREERRTYPITAELGLTDRLSGDRESTRLNSRHRYISYAGFCFQKKKTEDTRASES